MTDCRVYIEDKNSHEIEIYTSLFDEGIYVGVYLEGPQMGEEIDLTSEQVKEAKSKLED